MQINFAESLGAAILAAPKMQKLRAATQGVESIFLKDLLSIMRRSIPKSDSPMSVAMPIYEDMMDQSLADTASKTGSFGIGTMLYKQLAPAFLRQLLSNSSNMSNFSNSHSRLDLKG
jgi:Rod binding domain-containing protein